MLKMGPLSAKKEKDKYLKRGSSVKVDYFSYQTSQNMSDMIRDVSTIRHLYLQEKQFIWKLFQLRQICL